MKVRPSPRAEMEEQNVSISFEVLTKEPRPSFLSEELENAEEEIYTLTLPATEVVECLRKLKDKYLLNDSIKIGLGEM